MRNTQQKPNHTTMNTETHTPIEPEKMQIRLSIELHMPIILCPKYEPPHKGELKHMSIYELREFFRHVRSFFDLYVQDAENGAPVRICSCYYEDPNPEKETYYLPVRKQHSEPAPQVEADSPAAKYVLHADTLIQHPHSEEWLPLSAITEESPIPFGAGQLVMQKSPACTQKFRQPVWSFPRIPLPYTCLLTFERHCTLHLVVASGQAEQYSLLLRGHSVPPPELPPEPGKKKKEQYKKTKRLKKKRKALPHLPLPNSCQPPSSPCTWEEKQEYLYELFLTGDSPVCIFYDSLDARTCPTLAKLVNYPTQH